VRALTSRPDSWSGVASVLLVAMALGFPISVLGQEEDGQAEDSPQEFFEIVDVEVANIDVWVNDKEGRPVTGLTKGDFEVFRDGRPIEVTNFYAVSSGRVESSGVVELGGEALPLGSEVQVPSLEVELSPEHQLWVVVYIDHYNLHPLDRDRILPSVRDFLNHALSSGGKAMILGFDRGLEVVSPFTDQAPLLWDALEDQEGKSGFSVVRDREQFEMLKRIDDSNSASRALADARQYAEERLNSVRYTIDALERVVDSLGGLPGRKALLYVSSGVPMVSGEEMFHAVAEKFGSTTAYAEIPRHSSDRDFEQLNEYANSQRVVFYTLDASGLQGSKFGAAEYGGFVDPSLRSTLDSVVAENLQAPLRFMALETGGQAIVNRNNVLPALDDVIGDMRTFYSLGVSTGGGDDEEYHEIEVKFKERRKGWTIRHRGGYRSKGLDERVREGLESALLYEHAENHLGVTVQWGKAEREGGRGNYVLPIELHVPLRSVEILPVSSGKHEARLKLLVGTVDEDGVSSEIADSPFGIRLDGEYVDAARQESLVHTHRLLIGPGRRKVGVAIVDLFGRTSSVVTGYLQIGPKSERIRMPRD